MPTNEQGNTMVTAAVLSFLLIGRIYLGRLAVQSLDRLPAATRRRMANRVHGWF